MTVIRNQMCERMADIPPPPCEDHPVTRRTCRFYVKCKHQRVDCQAFRFYIAKKKFVALDVGRDFKQLPEYADGN